MNKKSSKKTSKKPLKKDLPIIHILASSGSGKTSRLCLDVPTPTLGWR